MNAKIPTFSHYSYPLSDSIYSHSSGYIPHAKESQIWLSCLSYVWFSNLFIQLFNTTSQISLSHIKLGTAATNFFIFHPFHPVHVSMPLNVSLGLSRSGCHNRVRATRALLEDMPVKDRGSWHRQKTFQTRVQIWHCERREWRKEWIGKASSYSAILEVLARPMVFGPK